MATADDVRRIARKLPGAIESHERLGFSVMVKGKEKGFLWSWSERVHPKKPKVINEGVVAIIVGSLTAKDIINGSDPHKFVQDSHYNGFPAVLVRLEAIELDELGDLITEAWRCQAPKDLVKEFDEG